MHFPERLIAVSDRIYEDQHTGDVVVVTRLEAALLRPLVDREEVARPDRDPGVDASILKTALQRGDDSGNLAGGALRGAEVVDHLLYPPVLAGIQDCERTVLQLPLDHTHAEPMRQGREDLEGHPGDARLLGRRLEAESPHVVETIGNLDDKNPIVLGKGDDQFPQGLRLGLGRVAETHLVELGHPIDDVGDLKAEIRGGGLQCVGGVLDGVVQQCPDDRGGIHPEFGENLGDRERVGDVRVAAVSLLTGMLPVRDVVCVDDEADVGLGMMQTVRIGHFTQLRRHRRRAADRRHPAGQMGQAGSGQPGGGKRTRGFLSPAGTVSFSGRPAPASPFHPRGQRRALHTGTYDLGVHSAPPLPDLSAQLAGEPYRGGRRPSAAATSMSYAEQSVPTGGNRRIAGRCNHDQHRTPEVTR